MKADMTRRKREEKLKKATRSVITPTALRRAFMSTPKKTSSIKGQARF